MKGCQRADYRLPLLSILAKGGWRHGANEKRAARSRETRFGTPGTAPERHFLKQRCCLRGEEEGDVLVCEVRVTQTQTGPGLRTCNTIIKVIQHIPAMRQLKHIEDQTLGTDLGKADLL
jgi:hypothetical protein